MNDRSSLHTLMAVKAWDELPARKGYQVNKQNGR